VRRLWELGLRDLESRPLVLPPVRASLLAAAVRLRAHGWLGVGLSSPLWLVVILGLWIVLLLAYLTKWKD